jgi:hypothetical protein
VLPGNYTFLLSDLGDRNFPATLKTAGTRFITATDVGTPSINGSQAGIVVNSAAAVSLTVTGFASTTTAGVPHSLTVTAFDAFDNVASGYRGTVLFTSTDGGAALVLPSPYTFVSGDAGTRVFGGVTLVTAGTQSITATDDASSSITGTQGSILVNPAAASHFDVTGYPSPVTSGIPHNVTVTARDAFENVATGYLGTVAITSSDPAPTLPANHTFTGPEAGVHVFSVTLNTAGNQSITATDTVTASITGSQLNIAVDPGPIDHIVISPDTISVLAGVDQAYSAEGFDLADNDLGDFTSNTTFTISGGGSCVGNLCQAATVGDHTVTGTDSVDGVGPLSDTATLTILNEDPTAVDDFPSAILEDATATTFDVLANDSDVNLDGLTISGKTDGAKGTVAITNLGADLTYTPNADANGADTFTYTLDDGNGGSAVATVHVTITPVNDAPTFTVQASTTIAEQSGVAPQSVSFFATAISTGPADESAQNPTFTISNNAPTLFAVQPSVNVNTGTLTYTPAVHRNGTATVTLVLHDDGGTLNGGVNQTTHTFLIIVVGPNHAPFAINDAYTVVSGSPATAVPVLVNDNAANPDVGEVLKIANVTQGAHGTVAITGGGTGLTYRPKSGFIGVDFFTYRVKDATLFSGYATVRVSVPKDLYKPASTAPVQTISGQTIGSNTVVVHLAWTGTDRGYGIKSFELWQSVNGHSYTKIKTTSGHSASVTTKVGSSYRFRVRATDKVGNVGSYAYGSKFKVNLYQESSASYSSPWIYLTGSAYSGGHARTTTTAGLSASFTSIGRTFSWVSSRGPTRGTADVYIDGVLVRHITLTLSVNTYRYLAYSVTFAGSALHTVKIVYTGGLTKRIDVDAFIVLR